MKKFLFPLLAVCAGVAPAFADEVYGTTPETAKPFPKYTEMIPGTGMMNPGGWLVESLDDVPAEVWFTIQYDGSAPAQWGDAPGEQGDHSIFVYLCDGGQEAFQRDEAAGSNSYVLFPGQEYLVKITPKATGTYGMFAPTALNPNWKGKYKYYPINRTSDDPSDQETYKGLDNHQEPGSTVWYLYESNYPAQLQFQKIMVPVMNITSVEAIHIECPGGTNTGTSMMPPYIKAGKTVIGVTVSDDFTEDDSFTISINAVLTLNCNNNLLRGQSLKLDSETTYPDAYYTVDRYFKVPEDGTYTFFNHGAKGTILNVGMVNVPDPVGSPYESECDWTNIKSATVGNDDAVVVYEGLKKDDIVVVESDAFGVIGKGMEDMPYLKVVKGDQSSISNVAADEAALKVTIVGNALNVKSVLLASGAEVVVYDMQARKVASAVASVGAESMDMNLDVAAGVYVVVVYGKGNSESAKIVVK